MFTYKKTQLTSPLGLFIAKEQTKQHEGKFHIYRKGGLQPFYTYNIATNRMVYVGGIAEISPEGLRDIADLCSAIFDND